MILDEIAEKAKERVQADKEKISLDEMIEKAKQTISKLPPFAFENALKAEDVSFICEVKKASPSKGVIAEDFPYVKIATEYEEAGASCVSVLTEPFYFLGSDTYLQEIREAISLPIIRKDFTIDEYQIYQAKTLGADCVLLICALLDSSTLKRYLSICDSLGLSAIVEAHDEDEIQSAIEAGARIIGVNNRNLKNFTVNVSNSTTLREKVPTDVIFVAESGIKSGADIRKLRENNVDAVLIGETLMRSENKGKMLRSLKGTKIKVCGLMRSEDIQVVNEAKPDYIGFVFANTRRYVSPSLALELKKNLSPEIKAVGVFQNHDIKEVCDIASSGAIDIIQLHGDEDEEYLQSVREKTKLPIIKAIKAISTEQIAEDAAATSADLLLIDSVSATGFGGTGTRFDLTLLPKLDREYFIAGGIELDNVAEILDYAYPYAVDVSSGVETDKQKDPNKIITMIEKVRDHYE